MASLTNEKQRERDYKAAQDAQAFFKSAVEHAMTGKAAQLEGALGEFLRQSPGLSAQDVLLDFQSEGRTLLHIAAASGHAAVFDLLVGKLDHKGKAALVNRVDDKGFTPLINATIGESATIMARLIKLGAQVNARNRDQAAAVHFAAGDGSVERTKLLIDAGADVTLTSLTGGNCLHWAAGKGRSSVIRYLLSLGLPGLDVNLALPSCPPAVIMAAVASSDEGVVALVEAGADTGMLLSGNLTLLHICAEQNLTAAAAAIVKSEAGKKCCLVETSDGNKPLHLAAMHGLEAMVRLLLPHSDVGGASASVPALLADGKERLKRWEAAHGPEAEAAAQQQQQQSAPAAGGNGSSSSSGGSSGGNKPRSARVLEPVAPAADAAAAARADASKDAGNEHFKAKRYPEALAAYTEAIVLQGDDATFWSNRSACYLALGDAPNALLDAEVCRRLRPDWTKGCYRLAAARMELGLYEDAAVAAFEGLKLDNANLPLKQLCQEAVKRGKEEFQKSQPAKP